MPWKIVVTSGSHFQLKEYLWPEVHLWARRIDWDALGIPPWRVDNELLKQGISCVHGGASSASPSRPDLIEGAHAEQVLVVFDESKAIPASTFNALEGVFSNVGEGADGHGYALAVSTPGGMVGTFYNIHVGRSGYEDWWTRHVTVDEAVDAGRVTRAWAERLERMWGRASALFRQHVLGEFAADDDQAVCPIEWIEAAVERWRADPPVRHQSARFGLDVAREGKDESVLAVAVGNDVVGLETTMLPDTMRLVSWAVPLMGHQQTVSTVTVDADGVGAGVADRLGQMGYRCHAFKGNTRGDFKDETGLLDLFNQRTAAWWNLRVLLDPKNGVEMKLPPDDQLIGDLNAPRWDVSPVGKIRVEDKATTKKRIGRSPDRGDAVVYCLFRAPEIVAEMVMPTVSNVDDLLNG